jgi:hypothetical protein
MRARLVRYGTTLVIAATAAAGLGIPVIAATPAGAAAPTRMARVSPSTDPATGFPRWYEDAAGTRLELCVRASDLCLAGSTAPDPSRPPSVPGNFPSEAFYYNATSTMTVASGVKAVLTMAVEGAFGNVDGNVVAGDQITFSRIQVRVASGLRPGARYTITSPYGTDVVQADDTGAIRPPKTPASRYEHGCGAVPPDCDFGILLSGRIGPFLVPAEGEPASPAGYIGDGVTPHKVTGSPLGTNVFKIDGPGIGTDGSDAAQTDQFTVAGKLAGPIQVDPASVRFPGAEASTAAPTQHVQVRNIGPDPMTLTDPTVTGDSDFTASLGTCAGASLARDDACALDVDFTPSDATDHSAVLTVGDGTHSLDVALRGRGRETATAPTAELADTTLTFPTTQVGSTSDAQTTTLTNNGTAALSVLGVHLTGPAGREYQLSANDCGDTLPAGESCTLSVRFAPRSDGARPASLVVDDDAAGSPHEASLVGTGRGGLVAVSPSVDPTTGFARWYEDSNGVRLQPCLDPTAPCAAGAVLPNGGAAPQVPNNFPSEAFYFLAQSTMDVPANATGAKPGKAVFVAAVEGAFGNVAGVPTPGEQITFSRIQVKVTGGLQPGSTYTITDPYGSETVVADVDGAIRPPKTPGSRYQYGCGAVPPACDFGLLLGGRVGPFLTRDPLDTTGTPDPDGFIGDGVTEHKVVGSPFDTNYFEITGPKPGGGTLSVRSELFTLNGMTSVGPSSPDLADVSDTGSSSTDDVTNATTLTFTGGALARVPVNLYVDGTNVATQTSGPDGSYSLTVSDVSAGTHQVTATETKPDGTESRPSAPHAVTVDLDAPVAAVLASTSPPSPGNTSTPGVLGSAEEDATVDVYDSAGCLQPPIGTGTGAQLGTGVTVTVPTDQTSDLYVRQTDLAGNLGPCSTTPFPYTEDSTPPPAPTFRLTSAGGTINQTTATVAFTDTEPAVRFQCQLDDAAGGFGPCTSPVTYNSLSEGTHSVRVRAVDTATNPGPAATRTWTVDTVGPTAALADTAATAFATSHPLFAFVLSEAGSTAMCALEPVQPSFAACSSPADFGQLDNGSYTLKVRGTDPVGNTGPVASIPVTVDTVAPPATIAAGPVGPTSDPTPAFAFGSTDPSATFACGVAPDGAPVPALTPCVSPTRTATLPTGTFRFFVRSTDAAGNQTTTSQVFVEDRTAPAAPTAVTATAVSRSAITLRWSPVQDTTTVAYRVFRDGSPLPLVSVTGTRWSDTGLRAGTAHTYRVVAVDAAGNASDMSALIRATTSGDVVRPRISTPPTVVLGARRHARVRATVRWAATDAGGIGSYRLWMRTGRGAWHLVSLPTRAARSVTLQLASGHRYTFRVMAIDLAGNRSHRVAGAPKTVRIR